MNDLQIPAKFLAWALGIALSLGAIGSPLKEVTCTMAMAALNAQKHDQMSWGKFSRRLWSHSDHIGHVKVSTDLAK